nr:retrovirus-related Pol polyprotein from transposon TNT 1-94 [Tanacetum cinerariifolium]
MPTKIELTLEQSQQGVSYDVLVAICSSLRVLKTNVHKSSLEPIKDQKYQLADLFTKALPVERFQYLVRRLEKVEKGIVELFFVGTEYQLADLFTKALPVERFQYLVRRLGMRCLTPAELEVLANESA